MPLYNAINILSHVCRASVTYVELPPHAMLQVSSSPGTAPSIKVFPQTVQSQYQSPYDARQDHVKKRIQHWTPNSIPARAKLLLSQEAMHDSTVRV